MKPRRRHGDKRRRARVRTTVHPRHSSRFFFLGRDKWILVKQHDPDSMAKGLANFRGATVLQVLANFQVEVHQIEPILFSKFILTRQKPRLRVGCFVLVNLALAHSGSLILPTNSSWPSLATWRTRRWGQPGLGLDPKKLHLYLCVRYYTVCWVSDLTETDRGKEESNSR